MVGKIFIAKIYFTDFSTYKYRPVVLIKEYQKEDFLYLPVTSNLSLSGIKINNDFLESGTLIKESLIIVSKIGIIHKSLLTKEVGKLKKESFKSIMKTVCKDLGCN